MRWLVLATLVAIAIPSDARAGGDDGKWYGWQIAIGDAVGDALMLGALVPPREPPRTGGSDNQASWLSSEPYDTAIVSVLVTTLDGPIIHGIHSNWRSLAGSAALRVVLPVSVGFAGSGHSRTRTVLSFLAGQLAAEALDDLLLAREPSTTAAAPRVMFSLGGRF